MRLNPGPSSPGTDPRRAAYRAASAPADCRDKKHFATLTHPIKYAASTHLTIDRHRDRRLDVAIFDQMIRESGKLAFQIGDELADIASARGDAIAAISQFAQ